jgi:hypothetical protein
MRNLFSIDRWDFFPVSQFISFVSKSICFLFLAMCSFQFNLQSKCIPMYFTASVWGIIVWLMLTAGQWPFRRVNVMCDDLDSSTSIFYLKEKMDTIPAWKEGIWRRVRWNSGNFFQIVEGHFPVHLERNKGRELEVYKEYNSPQTNTNSFCLLWQDCCVVTQKSRLGGRSHTTQRNLRNIPARHSGA